MFCVWLDTRECIKSWRAWNVDAIQPSGSTVSLTVDLLYEQGLECDVGV